MTISSSRPTAAGANWLMPSWIEPRVISTHDTIQQAIAAQIAPSRSARRLNGRREMRTTPVTVMEDGGLFARRAGESFGAGRYQADRAVICSAVSRSTASATAAA